MLATRVNGLCFTYFSGVWLAVADVSFSKKSTNRKKLVQKSKVFALLEAFQWAELGCMIDASVLYNHSSIKWQKGETQVSICKYSILAEPPSLSGVFF